MAFTWSNTIKSSDATITNSGKTVSITGGWAVSEENIASGKHYFEFVIHTYSQIVIGISQRTSTKPTDNQIRAMYGYDGNKVYPRSSYGSSYNTSNTIGIAIDMDKGEISFTRDGINLGVAFNNLKELGEIKLYMSTSTGGGREALTIVEDLASMNYPNAAKDFLLEKPRLSLKNPVTNKYYSLTDSTLIHLPDNSSKSMILYGIEKDKEIQLNVPFDKHRYINESSVANVAGKVFTQDIGKINTLKIREVK